MKLIPKKITLKEDTMKDIEDNNIDTDIFLERITDYLEKVNYLLDNKMIDLSSLELYEGLNKVFDIYLDARDYLTIFSMVYHKYYTKYVTIHTNMFDNESNNVSYYAAATFKCSRYDGEILDLNRLRNLTNSNDLLILKTELIPNVKKSRKEKFELHQYVNNFDFENQKIEKYSDFFLYAIKYLKNNILIKDILYDLKLYIDEIIYQTRCITGLAFDQDETLSKIGKKYKKAYDDATNRGILPKKEKVSVYHHKKVKKKG